MENIHKREREKTNWPANEKVDSLNMMICMCVYSACYAVTQFYISIYYGNDYNSDAISNRDRLLQFTEKKKNVT